MMIKCPRCGFAQPEDQYCAQCGVNMHSFQPIQKSFISKLISNVALQVILLLVVAVVAGSYLMQGNPKSNFGQKTDRSVISKNAKAIPARLDTSEKSIATNENLPGLTNKEISIATNADESLIATQPAPSSLQKANNPPSPTTVANAAAAKNLEPTQDSNTVLFKLTYAEVSTEILQRWITESSNAGLFQNLQDYSAGIVSDFSKYHDKYLQTLSTSEKKLSVGLPETYLTGGMSEDRSQMIGLSVTYEIKSIDGNSVHGTISVSKLSRQNRETFPAEFDLPKGSAFFMTDAITRQSFVGENQTLTMPPFQIFKSPNFISQKSKFIIILEPALK
ncbi:MAG: zinc ribbon domain-containing protein [Pseudobdellovibrio sp.]